MSQAEREEKSPAYRVLLQRNFAPYFFGNLFSASGTWIQNIAQALLIFRLTGSTFLVAMVTFSQFLGLVLLAPWSGRAADRWDRKRLLIVTQAVSAGTVTALAIVTAMEIVNAYWLIGAALIVGFAKAFAVPPQQALVPALVERNDLQSAVALNSITYNLARAVGPIVGVALIAGLGFVWAFAVNGLSYLLFIVALSVVDIQTQERQSGAKPKLIESVKLVRHDATMLPLLVAVGLVAFSIDPVNNLTPAFSVDIYGLADTFAGVLTGAFGLGAVVAAALVVARASASFRAISLGMASVGVGMMVFGVTANPVVGVVSLFITGMAFISSVSLSTTVVQMVVADEHRGRVMALWGVSFLGVRPLASLVDGTVATWLGLQTAAVVMALPVLAGAVYVWRAAPLRDENFQDGKPIGTEEEL